MVDLNDDHDLEVHAQELKRLDDCRKESAQLRDKGYQALNEEQKYQDLKNTEHKDSMMFSLYLKLIEALILDPNVEFKQKEILVKIENFEHYFTIGRIAKHEMPIILATQAMQILTMVPGAAFSEPALLCWYWIIREIFTAESPDWSIGGARAGEGDYSSAYTTIECVNSLQSFAKSYEYTGKFFGKLGEIQERLEQLKDSHLPESWQEMERKQILLSGQADILRYWSHFALSIPSIERADLEIEEIDKTTEANRDSTKTKFDVLISKLSENLPKAISKAQDNFLSVKEYVINFLSGRSFYQ